jgi:hypothetical protein
VLLPRGGEDRGVTFMTVTVTDGHTSVSEVFAIDAGGCGGVFFPESPVNHLPLVATGGPYSGVVGSPIALDGTASSDPEGQSLAYAWNFGDGSVGMGPTVTHAYSRAGEFQVDLIVSDGHGWTRAATVASISEAVPPALFLSQNRPNPFNPTTTIEYGLAEAAHVTLRIYDVSGRLVRELVQEHVAAGVQAASWDGRDDRGASVSSGVYYYELKVGSVSSGRRMVLMR